MKINTALLCTTTVIGLLSACSPSGPRTVEFPFITFANSPALDIVKVELTDSNTVLDVNAYSRPSGSISIAETTTLSVDGKTYVLTGTEGIVPGHELKLPESGESAFRLVFEPLPFNTRQFDLIEAEDGDTLMLLDIDISGKTPPARPKGLPRRFAKAPADGPVPQPAFEIGTTTVNVQMLPYRKELDCSVSLNVTNMDSSFDTYEIKIDDLGHGSVTFDQYGSANAILSYNRYTLGEYTLYPGEATDIYIDGRSLGAIAMLHRDGFDRNDFLTANHTGHYSDFDRMKAMYGYNNLNKYRDNRLWADYHMTDSAYMKAVNDMYLATRDSIDALQAPYMIKELMNLYLQIDALSAVSDMHRTLERSYRIVHNDWISPKLPADSIQGYPTDDNYAEVIAWFDTTNPQLVTANNRVLGLFDWNRKGAEGDLSKSLVLFARMASKAKSMKLTDDNRQLLQDLSNPFFATACDSIQDRSTRAALQLMEHAHVTPTPAVAPDKVFDAIIAPHKGKVVMVDLWNTWCVPCRAALAANEPLKTGELDSEDIVWIYIADESSDHIKYLEMIPDIKGIHYKVSPEEIAAIRERFEVDGIPYYILIDRSGKAEGRRDLRDHDNYVTAIKSKL